MKLNFKDGLKEVRKNVRKRGGRVIVGVAGGSCSGKGYFAKNLGYKVLSTDSYYKPVKNLRGHNFDIPSSVDLVLLRKHLLLFKKGRSIEKPIYSFKKHKRVGWKTVKPCKVIVVEGLYALHKKIRDLINVPVFLESNIKIRRKRRMERDTKKRGWNKSQVYRMFRNAEKEYKKYIYPTRKGALVVHND